MLRFGRWKKQRKRKAPRLKDTVRGESKSDFDQLLDRFAANDSVLTKINLNDRNIGNVEAKKLAGALQGNTSVDRLDLQRNYIGDEGAEALAGMLQSNSTLSALYFGWNVVGNEGAKALAGMLRENTTLCLLGLGLNMLGDDGVMTLAGALRENTSLSRLCLRSNGVGDEGVKVLADALHTNSTLSSLDLAGNSVGIEGARALAVVLHTNSALSILDLARNSVGDIGARAFAEALRHNSTLSSLKLWGNGVGSEGARVLAEALCENSALSSLDLQGSSRGRKSLLENNVMDGFRSMIDEMLQINMKASNPQESHQRKVTIYQNPPANTVPGGSGQQPMQGKMSTQTGEDTNLEEAETEEESNSSVSAGREVMREAIVMPDMEPTSIPLDYLLQSTDDFSKERQLGEGSFSRVYMGKDYVLRRKFAVKRMKLKLHADLDLSEARQTFEREIVTLKHFRHPNIAKLYAYHLSPDLLGDNCLVYELASQGSLYEVIKDKDRRERLHWTKRISIALDVARALNYLHGGKGGQTCYHRDVKSSNICLKRDFTALLIDCGVAKMAPQSDSTATMTIMESAGNGFRGTPGYICPMYACRMRNYSSANEVFSLGVVLSELFTGFLQNDQVGGEEINMFDRYSADGLENLDLIAAADASAGPWDAWSKEEFATLAVKCMNLHPPSRPKISGVVECLGNLASKARPWSLGERNRITVLSSDPLVWSGADGNLHPIPFLDLSLERDLMLRCIKESNRNIELSFDVATDDRLQAAATKRCSCLHFSGHGHSDALLFEDNSGGALWLTEDKLLDCVHEEPFVFVFVSSCYSLFMGEAFVKAGVRHVICCEQGAELRDDAALKFTYIFYLALAEGYTVQAAFQKGKMAVSTRFDHVEVDKFVLLPGEDVDHDVPLFDAEPMQWKDEAKVVGFIPSLPPRVRGREVDVYVFLNLILSSRLVNLVGGDDNERRNMASAVCHYIMERRTVMLSVEVTYFLRGMASGDQIGGNDAHSECVLQLHEHLASEGRVGVLEEETDVASMAQSAIKALQGIKALVVFDGGVDPALVDFIASLVAKSNAKVLVVSPEQVNFAAVGIEACVFDCTDG